MVILLSLVSLFLVPAGSGARLFIFIASDCPISNYYAREIQDICATNRRQGLTCTLVY